MHGGAAKVLRRVLRGVARGFGVFGGGPLRAEARGGDREGYVGEGFAELGGGGDGVAVRAEGDRGVVAWSGSAWVHSYSEPRSTMKVLHLPETYWESSSLPIAAPAAPPDLRGDHVAVTSTPSLSPSPINVFLMVISPSTLPLLVMSALAYGIQATYSEGLVKLTLVLNCRYSLFVVRICRS